MMALADFLTKHFARFARASLYTKSIYIYIYGNNMLKKTNKLYFNPQHFKLITPPCLLGDLNVI